MMCSLTVVQVLVTDEQTERPTDRKTLCWACSAGVGHEEGTGLDLGRAQGRRMQQLNLKRGGSRPSLPCK